jgi:hypothetical protein
MVAGQAVDISAFIVLYIASAFLSSGTTQLMCLQFIIAGIVSDSACVGISSKVGNQPSPSCCMRHASSSSTIFTSLLSLKSATGGSLNAMCPFSPIPIHATSTGWLPEQGFIAQHLCFRIGSISVQIINFFGLNLFQDSFFQVFPETCGVGFREAPGIHRGEIL